MKPEIWGKYGWDFFHLVTLGYPENPTKKDKKYYRKYIQCLQYVLPCDKCKYNLKNHLKKYPLTDSALESRQNLIKWGIDLHNIVNYYTGKSLLTYTEASNELNKLINPPKYTNSNYFWHCLFVVLIFIIIIILIIYFSSKKN